MGVNVVDLERDFVDRHVRNIEHHIVDAVLPDWTRRYAVHWENTGHRGRPAANLGVRRGAELVECFADRRGATRGYRRTPTADADRNEGNLIGLLAAEVMGVELQA